MVSSKMTCSDSTLEPQLTLSSLKGVISPECFVKSLPRSLLYMIWDLGLLSTAFFTFDWLSSSWWGLLLYWNFYGFFMWSLFVIGHDCGHNSFSNYRWINSICGHICHTPLLVPFFPWAHSHRMHHQHHNHIDKDRSHAWFTEERVKGSLFSRLWMRSIVTPFLGMFAYLYFGYFDGSHILPIGKLYKESNKLEKIRFFISFLVIACFVCVVSLCVQSWSHFFSFYVGPWAIFLFWSFVVTYMHHHHNQIILFDDSSWDFLSGALQTVDREMGCGLDALQHHITDSHLVHHLFYTQIPHYHLKKATKEISILLKDKRIFVKNRSYIAEFWRLLFQVNYHKWVLNKKR